MSAFLYNQCYIDGEWVSADSAKTFDVFNPATGQPIGSVPDCGTTETIRAIAAAERALPGWRARSAKDRCALLSKLVDLIVANADALGELLTREQGKPIAQGRGEVLYGANYVRFYAEFEQDCDPEVVDRDDYFERLVYREPVGVCAAITPWNFPNAMIARSIGPALAAGCTVISKPAPETPLSALAIAALAEQAGIPPGVFNVIAGDAAPIAHELMSSPVVRKMSFTGSTEVGRILIGQSAETITRMTLEMGGNAPFIVFADADLDLAVANAVACKYRNAGQTCICANRFLIEEAVADAFTERLVAATAGLVVGNGLDADTSVGPLISCEAVDKVTRLVADAVDRGATIEHGAPGRGCDLFVEPLVLSGVTRDMQIFHEEIFGPVAAVITFSDEAEAIALANDTHYGLASYVMTGNDERAARVAAALEYGMVGVNTGLIAAVQAPFGGVKQSGYGREGSHHGLEEYQVLKYVCRKR
jgi:succinate-semialdehyde dehydrogenase/glutarate-semialdehyde dehydrogenase